MPSTVVNITAQAVAGAAKPGGGAAAGPLGAFEAVMGAFFAGEGGVIADGKGGSPFAGEGAADPAQHNLDVAKLPPKAHPAIVAASAQPAPIDAEATTAPPADAPVGSLVEAATPDALLVAPASGKGDAGKADADTAVADGEATNGAGTDRLPVEIAALAQLPALSAPPLVETTAAAPAAAEAAGPSVEVQPPRLPAEAVGEAPSKQAGKDEKPKTIPGANASDTARLHAAPNSAVAQAAAAQPPAAQPPAAAAETPVTPPVEPPAPAVELAAAETQAPPETAPPAVSRKSTDKPVRGQQATPAAEAAPQDAAQPARKEATAPSDASPTDKAPKLAAQAGDAPRAQPAQPAQPDEAMPAAPAEPSPRSHAATAAAPAEAAQVRGSPETVASLSAQIVKKLGARTTHFDVQLDPIGLGKVNVRVAINADGQVSAAMRFDNPQAAAELRSRASELQRALAQSGFDLSGGLSFDVAQDQGGGYGGQQNAFMNNDSNSGHAFRGRAFAAAMETAGDAAQAALPAGAYGQARGPATGVDVRI